MSVSRTGPPSVSVTRALTMMRSPIGPALVRSASSGRTNPSPSRRALSSVGDGTSSTSGCLGWRSAVDVYGGWCVGGSVGVAACAGCDGALISVLLKHHGDALADADAHRRQRVLGVRPALELVHERRHEPR